MMLEDVVRALRKRREQLGMGQTELALIAGFSQQTVSLWERGKRCHAISHLLIWANSLGLEVELKERKGVAEGAE